MGCDNEGFPHHCTVSDSGLSGFSIGSTVGVVGVGGPPWAADCSDNSRCTHSRTVGNQNLLIKRIGSHMVGIVTEHLRDNAKHVLLINSIKCKLLFFMKAFIDQLPVSESDPRRL